MKSKLINAMLNNIKNIKCYHGNFWLKTKNDYIRVIKSQKYIIEKVETRKGNFFCKPIYAEQCKYIQEWNYELIFENFKCKVDEDLYNKIEKKRKKHLLKIRNKELNKLININ